MFLKGTGRALCAGGDVKGIKSISLFFFLCKKLIFFFIDVVNSLKDPAKHRDFEHQIDTEYDMLHFMGTMKTPYIAVMDGITSKCFV